MKVYKCNTSNFSFSVGLVIVAANNIKEAKQLITQHINWSGLYLEKDFEEIPNLDYKGDKPKVLIELHTF